MCQESTNLCSVKILNSLVIIFLIKILTKDGELIML